MKLIILSCIFIFSSLHISAATEDELKEKEKNKFYSLILTREWELGIWRISNDKSETNESKMFKLSMTAQAFRYWILMKDGVIEKNLAYESQIRKCFTSNLLDVSTLQNPLLKDPEFEGGFGCGKFLDKEEYELLSVQFKKFITVPKDE